jgi:hypothetical protein
MQGAPMGPGRVRSTGLILEEEAALVAFRRYPGLPLEDCLHALQASLPHPSRSSLHRGLQRHGISWLPETEGEKPGKKKSKPYPTACFHIDMAEVQTDAGRLYLSVAIDRTSRFAHAEPHPHATWRLPVSFCAS